jgi:hypothetical protein
MMRAYFDESGHEGKGYVIVAGFFGDERAWEAFVPICIEFVFEEQHEYAQAVGNVMAIAPMTDAAFSQQRKEGRSWLSGVSSKGDDKTGQRARWSRPILEAGKGDAFGEVLSRDEIRQRIVATRDVIKRLYGV